MPKTELRIILKFDLIFFRLSAKLNPREKSKISVDRKIKSTRKYPIMVSGIFKLILSIFYNFELLYPDLEKENLWTFVLILQIYKT